jgi:phospholipid/cholesterol/gamma-HCH transport system permease protein
MSFIGSIENVGLYALLMRRVLSVPDRMREFMKEFIKGVYQLGVNSIWIVVIISFFIGAVIVMLLQLIAYREPHQSYAAASLYF